MYSDRLKKLIELRNDLANEEQSLVEIRKLIQKQINALDIEKLHLESMVTKPKEDSSNSMDIEIHEHNDKLKELDLEIPNHMANSEEEEEEEDDDDEDL